MAVSASQLLTVLLKPLPKPSQAPVIDFNLARMDELERVIKEKQVEAKGKPASAAFAMFKCAAALP